jgi:hypothetical protein
MKEVSHGDLPAELTTEAVEEQQSNPKDILPVVCSQAALAGFLNRSEKTARLMERLKTQGVVLDYERIVRGKYRVRLADPDMHRKLRDAYLKGELK